MGEARDITGDDGMADVLLTWYAAHRRDLPWRLSRDPYRIWVSEVMLQQTQVSTVIPYYRRFLARFPTVCALAAASLDEILALWEGLGYYARARNLHAAANAVCARHCGRLPTSYGDLMALPGIGEYIGGAIASIAFGEDVPAIDGNVTRVLCRLFDYEGDPTRASGKRALRGYAEGTLPHGRTGDFNQAMIELGAMICIPRSPLCLECPLQAFCLARARGMQAQRPVRRKRRRVPLRHWAVALIERDGHQLVVRRLPEGLLGGLWELPGGPVGEGAGRAEALRDRLRDGLGVLASVGEHLASLNHAYTHFSIAVRVYRCAVDRKPQPAGPWDAHVWLSYRNRGAYGLTGVTNKILDGLSWSGELRPRTRQRSFRDLALMPTAHSNAEVR